ncbi:MAG: sodium-dependent transporter [Bacillota bacterium]
MTGSENRGQFASKLGFILSAAGSAVGLGNIWKFPGKAYNGGGGSFLLVYILMIALIGTTVMLAEFVVGRKTQKNAIGALRELNKKYTWVGGLGILTGFIILCYYCQVGGWTIHYIVGYITESATVYADPTAYFYDMLGIGTTFPIKGAIVFPLIFLILNAFIISRGVSGGIEKVSTILMPVLFLLLIGLMIRACTLPGASEGLAYMFSFDFSKMSGETFLIALGQAFFSLSLGMGVMITYSSYLSKDENLISNTGIICVLDTCVALFAGFMIIPAVFATGVEPGAGGGFAFISLAAVFEAMPGGTIFAILFYSLLFFAAVTSSISIMQGTIAYLTEEKGWDKKKALGIISIIIFIVGTLYTLSQGHMDIKGIWWSLDGISYPGFGDFLEFLTDRLLLPVGALAITVFVGWVWGMDNAIKEATSDGKYAFSLASVWTVLLKYVAPAGIACIIIGGILFGMALS